MAIRTHYGVDIEIDDKLFSVTVTDPTKVQAEELSSFAEDNNAAINARREMLEELAYLQETFDINKTILADGAIVDKAKTWFEQKALNAEIFALKKKIKASSKEVKAANKALEVLYKKRFEMIVSGKDKAALQADIDTKGISYIAVSNAIGEKVAEAYEKK